MSPLVINRRLYHGRFESNMRVRFTMFFVGATIGRRFLETMSIVDGIWRNWFTIAN
jgi:hypothetical protein